MNYQQAEKILTVARDKLCAPSRWCKNISHRFNRAGEVQYCTIGAIREALRTFGANYTDLNFVADAFVAANPVIMQGYYNIPEWNDVDHRKHSEILQAFDRAIAYCQVHQEKDAPPPVERKDALTQAYFKGVMPKWIETTTPIHEAYMPQHCGVPYPFATNLKEAKHEY